MSGVGRPRRASRVGISAFVLTRPASVALGGGPWTRTDGKDFARLLHAPRCRALLEEHATADLAAALVVDQWHPLARTLAAIDAMLGGLPSEESSRWSEEEGDRYGYLFAELSGELSDFEYFYQGFFVQDLLDLRAVVEQARACGAEQVRLCVM
jgi:hypothetical protein